MKQILLLPLILGMCFSTGMRAQQFTFKKGIVTDSVVVLDSIQESFAIFLPTKFETSKTWPIIFVFDMQGKAKNALQVFKVAAENQGFILAASNNVNDSLSISQNIFIASRLFKSLAALLPLQEGSSYTAGFSSGAKMASLAPLFIKQIDGVISCGSALSGVELLNRNNPYHFVGIVGNEDFNYSEMLEAEKILNKLKFPNQLLVFDGGHHWPETKDLEKAMTLLTLGSMAKQTVQQDATYVNESLEKNKNEIDKLLAEGRMLQAYEHLEETISVYEVHLKIDSLKERQKNLKKDKLYKTLRRNENTALFKESLIMDDYRFNLHEDIATLNFNNLGWWNFQMAELKKYENKTALAERQMGKRLLAYVNALVEDNIDIEASENPMNMEALSFLWMLKTITEPTAYTYYLKIISDSSSIEDYGTALFYLEELLKNGYKDKGALYTLEHTALLRIMPEFNKIIGEYFKDARYKINEQ